MIQQIKNFTVKGLTVILVFSIVTINIPSLILCSTLQSSSYCQKSGHLVKCCLQKKNVQGQSLTTRCDCPFVSVPQSDVLYFSHTSLHNLTFSQKFSYAAYSISSPAVFFNKINHSSDLPPPHPGCGTYLFNLSLRI